MKNIHIDDLRKQFDNAPAKLVQIIVPEGGPGVLCFEATNSEGWGSRRRVLSLFCPASHPPQFAPGRSPDIFSLATYLDNTGGAYTLQCVDEHDHVQTDTTPVEILT